LSSMERFTQRARRVLSLAHQEAERMRHNYIGTEHLLLGLIREEGGVAGRVLRELGLEVERVQEMIERITGIGSYRGGKLDLSPGTQQVLELAVDEARQMGHHYIGTEHILLGLIRYGEGVALDVLGKLGIKPEQIKRQTRRVLQEGSTSRSTSKERNPAKAEKSKGQGKTPMVDQLAIDLTNMAIVCKVTVVVSTVVLC